MGKRVEQFLFADSDRFQHWLNLWRYPELNQIKSIMMVFRGQQADISMNQMQNYLSDAYILYTHFIYNKFCED